MPRLTTMLVCTAMSVAILPATGFTAAAWAQATPDKAPDQATPTPPPAPAAATDPNLAVATVKLEGGYRASKVVGAAVYNSENQQIGTVDDVILNHENQISLAVISVGGFLGVGGKLVALPYGKIERADNNKIILADGSKDALAKLPSFTYAQ